MLFSLLRSDSSDRIWLLLNLVMMIPVILLSLSVHEFAHGYVAYKRGDHTAKNFGRLTLNPIKHIDPIGALMMLFVGFGLAKPVPVNLRNLKNPKRDMVLVSLAGPVSNLILAFIAFVLQAVFFAVYPETMSELGLRIYSVMLNFFELFWLLNIGLAIFNLIPIPPLDGSKILAGMLPNNLAYKYLQLERYLRYFFFFLIIATWIPFKVGSFNDLGDVLLYPMTALRRLISYLMYWITTRPFGIKPMYYFLYGNSPWSFTFFKTFFGL